ncbi:hypothetical protein I6F48_00445 [Pseudoalteromonas sp. SWYJ118]|nr:hypothetical protein [Pseudoalteromonas sp. SWYJ118]
MEVLIADVIYHLILERNHRIILKVGTYEETNNYINRIDFDLYKRLHYSDNELGRIFHNLA